MLCVNEAISTLLSGSRRLVESENVDLMAAAGRTLAGDLIAPIDVPPADNSAMDGYAFRFGDWMDPETALPISQRITAGSVPRPLEPGSAARIFTGAEVPPGADTVVMQEHCDGSDFEVRIRQRPATGANIRRRGQDLTAGLRVLTAGRRMRAQDLGLAASLGIARVDVFRKLSVAVMSTGDELRNPGEELQPGQIYNSNRYTMIAQLKSWGFTAVDMGVAKDDPAAVRDLMADAAERADVVITSGGVSVGEEDHVKDVVESLGALDLWRIAVRPGKPFAFGRIGSTPFIGLPGNPVSVFVTLLVIARPFLFASQGIADTALHPLRHRALFEKRAGDREDYLRVRLTPDGLELFPNQSSGVLYSTSWGDGLVRQRPGEDIRPGELVDYLPYEVFN